MKDFALKIPTEDPKKVKLVLFDEASCEEYVDDSTTNVEGNPGDSGLEDLRKRFTGNVQVCATVITATMPLQQNVPLRPGTPSR